jgi:hypothetical protein
VAAGAVAGAPTTAVAGGQSLVTVAVVVTPQPLQLATGAATVLPVQLLTVAVLPWQLLRANFAFSLSNRFGPWQLLLGAATVLPVQLLTGDATVLPVQLLTGAVATTLAPWQLPWHEPRSRPKEAVSPPVVAAIMRTIVYIHRLLILVQMTRITTEETLVATPFRNNLEAILHKIVFI